MSDDLPPPDPHDRMPGEPPAPPHGTHDPHHPFREARETLSSAAVQAEMLTGRREETEQEARQGAIRRTARAFGGFALVGVGIALLPLPGPGWVVIIVGLTMLPFAWAERTVVQIRRRIPGVPEDGAIPLQTWIVMGLMVAAFTAVSILFGQQIGSWLGDVWTDLWGGS